MHGGRPLTATRIRLCIGTVSERLTSVPSSRDSREVQGHREQHVHSKIRSARTSYIMGSCTHSRHAVASQYSTARQTATRRRVLRRKGKEWAFRSAVRHLQPCPVQSSHSAMQRLTRRSKMQTPTAKSEAARRAGSVVRRRPGSRTASPPRAK
jgi:hypothetical protein